MASTPPKHDADAQEPLLVPLDFEIERSGRRTRVILASLLVFLACLIGLMAIAPLREVAHAPGVLKPAGEVVELRHVEGGKIDAIEASPGDLVSRGQVLIRLSDADAAKTLAQLEARRRTLVLRKGRFEALLAGKQAIDPTLALTTSDAGDNRDVPPDDLFRRASAQLSADRATFATEIAAKRGLAAQRRAESEAKRREAESLSEELATYDAQIEIRELLVARGAAPRVQLLELQAQRAEGASRRTAVEGAAEAAALAAASINDEIAQLIASRRSVWFEEVSSADAEIIELNQQIAIQTALYERMTIRAPIEGYVQRLGAPTAGGVVPPGGLAATIVPSESDMIAEVRVRPDDIGYIDVGELAYIRITTFDTETFGEIEGRVEVISPTSVEDETGQRYFVAELSLAHVKAEHNGQELRATPGMVVAAEIKTGSKSMLRYFLKPVTRALDGAFSER